MKRLLLVMLIVTVTGCTHFPPPCESFNGSHPCGEKVSINALGHVQ